MKPPAVIAQVGFIVVAALAVYAFVGAAQRDMRRSSCTALCKMAPAYAGSDRTAPDFELSDMNGQKVRLSSFRGKTVFLNFWTKTCAPCLEEMPSLAELARIAKGRKDFVVLTVSTDEGPDDVRDTLKIAIQGESARMPGKAKAGPKTSTEEVPFPVLFDPDAKVVGGVYGTHLFPETWIIDPQGVIRARFDGGRDWSTALAVEIGEMVQRSGGCPVEFFKSKPLGTHAGLCDDDS